MQLVWLGQRPSKERPSATRAPEEHHTTTHSTLWPRLLRQESHQLTHHTVTTSRKRGITPPHDQREASHYLREASYHLRGTTTRPKRGIILSKRGIILSKRGIIPSQRHHTTTRPKRGITLPKRGITHTTQWPHHPRETSHHLKRGITPKHHIREVPHPHTS